VRVGLRAELTGRILGLPGVEVRRSRFTGDEAFFVGTREIAHFHGERVLDIRLARARIRALGDARARRDWLEFPFARRADLDRAVGLVREAILANS
jgi:hypothetical protein